jgi:hypothetical protein
VEELNTLQMVSRQKKGITIHSEAREMIKRVNHQCKQEAEQKSLILLICCAGERTANLCMVGCNSEKDQTGEQREKLCRDKALYF